MAMKLAMPASFILGTRAPALCNDARRQAMYEALMRDQVTEQERALILGVNIQRLFGLAD